MTAKTLSADKPSDDQIEITLIGPGFGECCIAHLGNGFWIIIDSCIDNRSRRPAALQYFDYIGQDPVSVKWIIASHWHDDHVRGLAETLKACEAARFCGSSALSADEFLATVAPYDQRANFQRGSGVSELFNVLEELKRSGRSPVKRAGPDRRIDFLSSSDRPYQCEIWTLSPSDEQVNRFLGCGPIKGLA